MKVWIECPFDNLPEEGYRKQRYRLMAEAFLSEGHEVVYWTTDFNHGTKARRRIENGKWKIGDGGRKVKSGRKISNCG